MTDMDANPLPEVLRRCRTGFGAVGAFSLLVNLLTLTASVYMMQVFDRVLTSGSVPTLLYLTVIALGALALLGVFDVLRMRVLARLGSWLDRTLAPAVLARMHDASVASPGPRPDGLRDLAAVRAFVSGTGVLTLLDAPWVPIFLAVIYALHPAVGHAALAGAALLFALAWAGGPATRRPLRQAGEATAAGRRLVEAGLRNAETVDAMGLLPALQRRWAALHAEALARQGRDADRAGLLAGLSKFARLAVQVAVLGVGAWLVLRQELTAGGMIAASIVLGRALAPVEQAIGVSRQWVEAREAYGRVRALLSRRPRRGRGLPLPIPRGRLEVEGLGYARPDTGRPILKGVSFAVEPGEALAVVGPSAAGKSTLARLLVGVLPPSAGRVRLDGADVFAWRRDDLGRHVGYLAQDVALFPGTVAENVARLADAEPAEIVAAARRAQAHEMILRLPDGYETEVGEGGALLSGGQRQRVALARALFGSPVLLVLDEPNANLDAEGEDALNRAIAAAKASAAAVVVIGHRPATLAQVDRVLVLRDGRIDFLGPKAELLDRLRGRRAAPVAGRTQVPAIAPVQEEDVA